MMTGPNGGSATWLNVDTKNPDPIAAVTWNATKVAAALADTLWDGTGSQAMICLSAFPALWADANASKVLNASFANAWVSLAAELQAIIARLGVRIDYWEITNEWDQAYAAVGNTSGLADLVLATAAVLRAADPTVKVRSAFCGSSRDGALMLSCGISGRSAVRLGRVLTSGRTPALSFKRPSGSSTSTATTPVSEVVHIHLYREHQASPRPPPYPRRLDWLHDGTKRVNLRRSLHGRH